METKPGETESHGVVLGVGSRGGPVPRTRGDLELAASAADAAPSTILVVDGTGRIVFANAHAGETFGRSPSELMGGPFEELLVSGDRETWRADLTSLLSREGPVRVARVDVAASSAGGPLDPPVRRELTALGPGGQPVLMELSLTRFDADGEGMGVIVLRDFTEKRRLRDTRERLEALLEFAPAFIIGVTRDGAIEFINKTLPQYTRKETIGSSWLQYFPPDRQAVMASALKKVYATGSTEYFEVTTPGPDGQPLWFESHIGPVRVGGKIAGAVLVSQDISERKRAHAELLAGRHMALLGTLAAGVAHEINTPVQFVGDSVQFLRNSTHDLFDLLEKLRCLRRAAMEGSDVSELARAAAVAEEEIDLPYLRENMPDAFDRCVEGLSQVATIVRSLKDFAHPLDKEKRPADLNRAVETSLTIARSEYKYVADVTTDFQDLPPVTCHVNEIGQVVLNVLVNAAHAIADVVRGTDRKGLISVRTWRERDTAVIAIQDTGGGIPEDIRARIFDPFFTTKEVGKGTGQGLAIALSTIKAGHGGDLSFETNVGEGTTFFIRLPIKGGS